MPQGFARLANHIPHGQLDVTRLGLSGWGNWWFSGYLRRGDGWGQSIRGCNIRRI